MYIHNNYCPYGTNSLRNANTEIEDNFNEICRATICEQFANNLGGKITESKPNSCSVEKDRNNISVTISGIPVKPVLKGTFLFQGLNSSGRALNLGEIAVLQDELDKFSTIIKREGITISAIHNHWIYDNPRLIYVHFQSTENPLSFSRKVAEALKVLR